MAKRPRLMEAMEPTVFLGSAALVIGFLIFGSFFTETAADVFNAMQAFIAETFGWFYILSVSLFVGFVIWLWFSPYGGIRPGGTIPVMYRLYLCVFLAIVVCAMCGCSSPLENPSEPITEPEPELEPEPEPELLGGWIGHYAGTGTLITEYRLSSSGIAAGMDPIQRSDTLAFETPASLVITATPRDSPDGPWVSAKTLIDTFAVEIGTGYLPLVAHTDTSFSFSGHLSINLWESCGFTRNRGEVTGAIVLDNHRDGALTHYTTTASVKVTNVNQ